LVARRSESRGTNRHLRAIESVQRCQYLHVMRATSVRNAWRLIVRRRELLLGIAIAGLLGAEYLADRTLQAPDLVVGCAVSVGIGTLVALRHRMPLGLLGATTGLIALRAFIPPGGDGVAWGIVSLLAIYTVASERDGWEARIGLALTVALALSIPLYDDGTWNLGDILFFGLLGGTPWVFGRAIRHRREREHLLEERTVILERDREQEMRLAVEEERTRIARELHDVVGHALGVIVLQADGGRRVLGAEPEETARALATIETTGREALIEMRRLVAMLRASDEQLALLPQPGLAQLDALAAQVRSAGLPVDVVVLGEPHSLPAGVDLSAYRIAQEGLTNVLKHAGPARATVTVHYATGEVAVEILDDGAGSASANGDGHGLTGIRERVAMFGGDVEAGPRNEGGYVVRARLPYAVDA
jgi:signal transduction histidine kinase